MIAVARPPARNGDKMPEGSSYPRTARDVLISFPAVVREAYRLSGQYFKINPYQGKTT